MRWGTICNTSWKFSGSLRVRTAQFHHLLSDIINGNIAEELSNCGLWGDPRPDNGHPLEQFEPGSEGHKDRFLPFRLAIVARRIEA